MKEAHSYYEPVTSCKTLHIRVFWMLECICCVSHDRAHVGWCLEPKEAWLLKVEPLLPSPQLCVVAMKLLLPLPARSHPSLIFILLTHCHGPSLHVQMVTRDGGTFPGPTGKENCRFVLMFLKRRSQKNKKISRSACFDYICSPPSCGGSLYPEGQLRQISRVKLALDLLEFLLGLALPGALSMPSVAGPLLCFCWHFTCHRPLSQGRCCFSFLCLPCMLISTPTKHLSY